MIHDPRLLVLSVLAMTARSTVHLHYLAMYMFIFDAVHAVNLAHAHRRSNAHRASRAPASQHPTSNIQHLTTAGLSTPHHAHTISNTTIGTTYACLSQTHQPHQRDPPIMTLTTRTNTRRGAPAMSRSPPRARRGPHPLGVLAARDGLRADHHARRQGGQGASARRGRHQQCW